jgi:adenine deaminase
MSIERLQRRVRVAKGQEAGDLLLVGGSVVNVFTARVELANVVICDGVIAGVGPESWAAKQTRDVTGKFILPGLIDSHMHLESTLLMPAELARVLLPLGTTATISDSHEIGNVLGLPGIDLLIEASRGLPFDLFFVASSCVPCTSWEHAGAVLGPVEVSELLKRPRVLALAEMMDFPALLAGDGSVLAKVEAAQSAGKPVDGHAPRLTGRDLMAYVACGITSDHESETIEEARTKAALGMLVQIREGSLAHNLDALLPLLVSGELGDDWTLVTDDILPTDLLNHGHIDGLLRRVVAAGVSPAQAVRHASLTPARHYGLRDRGAIAPGYIADVVVMNDLDQFRVHEVYKNGTLVARDGNCLAELPKWNKQIANSVKIADVSENAFQLRVTGSKCPAIRIVPGQLVNQQEACEVATKDGLWAFDPRHDVALIASIERHHRTGNVGLGLVSGFTFQQHGAIGSSVAHDSHNLVLAGTNARDMQACARALAEQGGGFVLVAGGQVRAFVPLPVAGLLSVEAAEEVRKQLESAHHAAAGLGISIENPFGVLSFLALPVIPELRVTDQGMWDVLKQEFVKV